MLYDYQFYSSMMAPQIIHRPSTISSTNLFQVISVALDRNLNDYLSKKNQIKAQTQQVAQPNQNKPKTVETIVINLESEEENNWPVTAQQRYGNSQNLKNQPIHESLLDTNHKEEIIPAEQNEFVSQLSQQLQKPKQLQEEKLKEQNTLNLRCMKKLEKYEEFSLFSVQCPKLGISNLQLLRKKEKLLRRKVVDWSEVDQKGPKQRREIRMLKN